MLEEIKRPVRKDTRPCGEDCPHCKVPVRWGNVGCPDGRVGCLVMHWGWSCPECGRNFRVKKET